MTPQAFCQDKAAPHGSSFYYATLYQPEAQQQALFAVEALWRELQSCISECSDESVARAKLDWWRSELARSLEGQARHPVGVALQGAIREHHLAEEYLQELIDGATMDLQYTGYQTFNDLQLYAYRTGAVRWMLHAQIMGLSDNRAYKYAHDLGLALRLIDLLQYTGRDAAQGRLYWPAQEMETFGVKPADFMQPKTNDRLQKLLAHQGQRIENLIEQALTQLPDEDRLAQLAALIMLRLRRSLLTEIREEGFQVLEHRTKLTPLRKLWLAWRTMRREKKLARRRAR